jgi:hypothetical protein
MAGDKKDNAIAPESSLTWEAPVAGDILVPPGVASIMRIPVPGTMLPNLPKGLVLTLYPPKGYKGSTSSIFIRNPDDPKFGKPGLRLDYGINKRTGRIDYHWNVEGGARARVRFPNITNHMPAGPGGAALHWGARAFRVGGRVFIVTGVIMDGVSIVVADRPWRRSLQVVSAWAAAGAGAMAFGRLGAGIGTFIDPAGGTAIGGGIGALAGSFIGYITAEAAAGYLYDFAQGTVFLPAPEVPVPTG